MALSDSITDFFSSLTKEPAEEFGGLLADRVKVWRFKQAIRLREKVDAFVEQRGILHTRSVPPKLVVAALDHATLEDDDYLHTQWATLLTNSVDPEFSEDIRVAYADILRSLGPFDAKLLHEIYKEASEYDVSVTDRTVDVSTISRRIKSTKEETLLSVDCLVRQRCVAFSPQFYQPGQYFSHNQDRGRWVTPPPQQIGTHDHIVTMTQLGVHFIRSVS